MNVTYFDLVFALKQFFNSTGLNIPDEENNFTVIQGLFFQCGGDLEKCDVASDVDPPQDLPVRATRIGD